MPLAPYRFSLLTDDSVSLPATLYPAATPCAWVVLGGGTGIAHGFYRHFASGLAARGFTVLSFDYRGFNSREAQPVQVPLRMADWGRRDLDAALQEALRRSQGLPVLYVGHSLGGQVFGLSASAMQVRAALLIASQSGYWRLWPGRWRWRRLLDWYLWVPAAIRLCGRLPGAVLGGVDLPAGIGREWARWCRSPHYLCEQDGSPMRDHFAALTLPMKFYCITDDDAFAPRAAVQALTTFYPNARTTLQDWSPEAAGLSRLGHFGVFRPQASRLWDEVADWLRAQL